MPEERLTETESERTSNDTPSGDHGGKPSAEGGVSTPTIVILVDISNVSYGRTTGANQPKIGYVQDSLALLAKYPVRVVGIADASLRHKIDKPRELEEMFSSGKIEQIPAGTSADDLLWAVLKKNNARAARTYIVTNDQFPRDRAKEESLDYNPRIAYLLIGGEWIFQPAIEQVVGAGPAVESLDTGQRPSTPSQTAPGESTSAEKVEPFLVKEVGAATQSPTPTRTPTSTDSMETPHPRESKGALPSEDVSLLIQDAIETIAKRTDLPGGSIRRINFATIAHDLRQKYEGSFVARFGLRKPKDLAVMLSEKGLVELSHTNTTLYVAPTPELDNTAQARHLARRDPSSSAAAVPRILTPPRPVPRVVTTDESTSSDYPEMVEVASREHGPTVEIPDPAAYVALLHQNRPRYLFHWSSRRRDEDSSDWKRDGEFFFTNEGTTYMLSGKGYKTIPDFLDGRKRGMKGVDTPELLGSRFHNYPDHRLWRTVLEFNGLDTFEYCPSEGDVYYYVKSLGFDTLNDFLKSAGIRRTTFYA